MLSEDRKTQWMEEKVSGGTWLTMMWSQSSKIMWPLFSSPHSPCCTPPACLYWTTFTFSLAKCTDDENSNSILPSRYILSPKAATNLDSWIREELAVHHAILFVKAEPECFLLRNPRGVPDPSSYFWLPPIFENHSGTRPTSHLTALFAQGGREASLEWLEW